MTKRNRRRFHSLKKKQVYAFEPIPDIYSVLVRNLHTSVGPSETGDGPKPVALRVALGAEQDVGEFHFFGGSPGESTRSCGNMRQLSKVFASNTSCAVSCPQSTIQFGQICVSTFFTPIASQTSAPLPPPPPAASLVCTTIGAKRLSTRALNVLDVDGRKERFNVENTRDLVLLLCARCGVSRGRRALRWEVPAGRGGRGGNRLERGGHRLPPLRLCYTPLPSALRCGVSIACLELLCLPSFCVFFHSHTVLPGILLECVPFSPDLFPPLLPPRLLQDVYTWKIIIYCCIK